MTWTDEDKRIIQIIVSAEQKMIREALGIDMVEDLKSVSRENMMYVFKAAAQEYVKAVKFSEQIDRKVRGNEFIANKMKKNKPRWQR
jgi:hypothetical protein